MCYLQQCVVEVESLQVKDDSVGCLPQAIPARDGGNCGNDCNDCNDGNRGRQEEKEGTGGKRQQHPLIRPEQKQSLNTPTQTPTRAFHAQPHTLAHSHPHTLPSFALVTYLFRTVHTSPASSRNPSISSPPTICRRLSTSPPQLRTSNDTHGVNASFVSRANDDPPCPANCDTIVQPSRSLIRPPPATSPTAIPAAIPASPMPPLLPRGSDEGSEDGSNEGNEEDAGPSAKADAFAASPWARSIRSHNSLKNSCASC